MMFNKSIRDHNNVNVSRVVQMAAHVMCTCVRQQQQQQQQRVRLLLHQSGGVLLVRMKSTTKKAKRPLSFGITVAVVQLDLN